MSKTVICMQCCYGLCFTEAIQIMDASGEHCVGFLCKKCADLISEKEGSHDAILDMLSQMDLLIATMIEDQESSHLG